ncbi:hypothetical protein, partial [Kingella kingae]|uniref:hypothetical protein n=1 Tax=Kingella kingae TaxID=504 RepID=UPI001E437E08
VYRREHALVYVIEGLQRFRHLHYWRINEQSIFRQPESCLKAWIFCFEHRQDFGAHLHDA